jgi:putative endonuclease
MYFVYAIKSSIRNYIYVGITNNIDRRFTEHNSGKNKTTRQYRPFSLIYSEKFNTRLEARQKEKVLKIGCGEEYLKRIK